MSLLNKLVGLILILSFTGCGKGCNDTVLELSALPSRMYNYSEQVPDNLISDKELVSAWYRSTLDGRLFLLSDSNNVTYGNCGTFYPIYSQDLHPFMSTLTSDISVIKACQYESGNTCNLEYNIPVRRCGYEVQYYLDPTIAYAAYCFDIQCVQGLYGENCEQECQCVEENTAYCYPDNGDCECKSGWSGSTCNEDVDECASSFLYSCPNNSECVNSDGSYKCVCISGYKLSSDGLQCEDTQCVHGQYGENCQNECQCVEQNTAYCYRDNGVCECKPDWFGRTCNISDRNECASSDFQSCPENSECINTVGSYKCLCLLGYKSSSDELQCEEMFGESRCNGEALLMKDLPRRLISNIEDNPENLLSDYSLMSGWYRPIYSGRSYSLAFQRHNVTYGNCGALYPVVLQDPHPPMSSLTSELTVMKGCSLDTDGTCSNLQNIMVRRCGHEIQYYLDATIPFAAYCYDIQCVQGLYGDNCEQECQCVEENTVYCYPDNGACECKPGWSGSACNEDVDECTSSDLHSCPDNSECSNTGGSYTCVCISGYKWSSDDLQCEAIQCVQGLYGDNCDHECQCVEENTAYCYPDNGACKCKPGWSGSTCNEDVDECTSSDLHSCPGNSECSNTGGSYTCVCMSGYKWSSDGLHCEECGHLFYGPECVLKCPCNVINVVQIGKSCRPDTGECFCKQGWTGFTCDVDINECENGNICREQNTYCDNLPGGYRCNCSDGYSRTDIGDCAKDSDGTRTYHTTIIASTVASIAILVFVVIVAAKYRLGKRKGNSVGSEQNLGDEFRDKNAPLQNMIHTRTDNVYDQISDVKRPTSSTNDYLHAYNEDDRKYYPGMKHDDLSRLENENVEDKTHYVDYMPNGLPRADYTYLYPTHCQTGHNGTPPKNHSSSNVGYM